MSWFGWSSSKAEPEEEEKKVTGKRSHYDVLGVSEDVDEAGLKKAYRAKALEFHPDKNRGREDEAAEEFKAVQAAFEVLSDPHERAYYAAHWDEATEATTTDLFAHFSSAVYDGFEDGPRSFYAVYAELFAELSQEEIVAAGRDNRRDPAPRFGAANAEWEETRAFYSHWEGFNSVKTFAFADKHNLAEAPNREYRRAMEKENRRDRAKEKKKFNSAVRELVAFVKKRDPRVKARKAQEDALKKEKEEARQAEEAKQAVEKRRRAREAKIARQNAMEEDADALDEILANIKLDEEIERRKAKNKRMGGDGAVGTDGPADEPGEDEQQDKFEEKQEDDLYCLACKKKFRTVKQAADHKKSKKHIAAAAALRKQIDKEDKLFFDCQDAADVPIRKPKDISGGAEGEAADDIDDNPVRNADGPGRAGDGDDASEDELAMPSASKKKKKKKAKKRQQQLFAGLDDNSDDGHGKQEKEEHADVVTPAPEEAPASPNKDEEKAQKAPLTKKQKRKEKERRRAQEQNGNQSSANSCNVCSDNFPSKTKLMQHVEKQGHARAISPSTPTSKKH